MRRTYLEVKTFRMPTQDKIRLKEQFAKISVPHSKRHRQFTFFTNLVLHTTDTLRHKQKHKHTHKEQTKNGTNFNIRTLKILEKLQKIT